MFRRSNNKYKITAGRPDFTDESDKDASEENLMDYDIADQQQTQKQDEVPQMLKDDNKDEEAKRKRPNVKIPTKKNARLDVTEIQGATHISKPKEEIKIRNSQDCLVKWSTIYLSDVQKKWVRDSGFGELLEFVFEILRGKLTYNIFQIFDHNSVSLKLQQETIRITEEDVFDVLGLPHRGEIVTLGPTEIYQERTNEWLAQFPPGKDREQITTYKLVQIMKGQGPTQNFKFNFLIVLSNVLFGTSTTLLEKLQ
ncbi:hypothetical protein POM88_021772 [Heracleum sosnowskyi]|uniref:Uncharacterized protein n=1 Tax=Heracleum sosnowskyi TaxID=360622 RepID=A0AAD8IDS8_9APIA|nr:hypothetical protein POM88_021772 [Heracleum sosnowskyi]